MRIYPSIWGVVWGFVFSCNAVELTQTNAAPSSEEGRYRSALLFASVVEMIRDEYLEIEKTDYDKMTL